MNVSVILPARNAAATLADALASLRAQTFAQWEAIIVDDGSTDATAQVAARFAQTDARFRRINGPAQGVSAARNTGLSAARFEWVLFLDADDWLLPQHLQRLTALAEAEPEWGAVHCGWKRVTAEGVDLYEDLGPSAHDLFPALGLDCVFAIHTCIVRRALIEAVGSFDTSLRTCEDWDLWQRLARAGVRFGAVREALAIYRVRPDSASQDAAQMLADSLQVVARAYASDPRVPNPLPAYAAGLPAAQLPLACLYRTGWAAGLALGRGQNAASVLNVVTQYRDPNLNPERLAAYLFYSATLPTCQPLSAWATLWPTFKERINEYLVQLEAHSGTPALARRTRLHLERLVGEFAVITEPLTLDTTYVTRLEVTAPIADIFLPTSVERLYGLVEIEGARLGTITLPVCDGLVPAAVLADAMAAQFAWEILGRFLAHTLYPQLTVEQTPKGWALKRGRVNLSDALPNDPRAAWPETHHHIGWAVFLQEAWGRAEWPEADFYEATVKDVAADRLPAQAVDADWHLLEISQPIPNLRTAKARLNLGLTIGGVMTATVTLPVTNGLLAAQTVRAAFLAEVGYELCRACVREGLLGQPLTHPASLSTRLAQAAMKRASMSTIPNPQPQRLLVGRHAHGTVGTSVSRRAALPAAALPELRAMAARVGEPVLDPSTPDSPITSVLYAPDWFSHTTQAAPEPTSTQPVVSATSAYDRTHFEALFARADDPWKYTSPYEQTKYEQTLAFLPPTRAKRALELACAEGHFTLQLAPQVDTLLAADISQIALERTAQRCQALPHVTFARLDLVRDALPGQFDLIVCSEVLYYVGGLAELRAVAQKIAQALEPGGYFLTAHANLVIDEPDQPGFDWPVPFGAKTISATFARAPGLKLVKELHTPLYRVLLFQREQNLLDRLRPRAIQRTRLAQQPTALPPDIAAHALWQGSQHAPQKIDTAATTTHLPILMYHRIAADGPAGLARYRLAPELFEAQLQYLQQAGFYSVSFDDWRRAAEAKRSLPGRAVLLTFDDGYRDFLTEAWPRLKRYGFSANVFIVTDRVGGASDWDKAYGEPAPLMSWDEIRALAQAGITFGGHTASHPFMTRLSNTEVVREVARTRAALAHELPGPALSFAYPYGDYDRVVQHLVGACGYTYAVTCEPRRCRWQDDFLALPRIEVNGLEDLRQFIANLGA